MKDRTEKAPRRAGRAAAGKKGEASGEAAVLAKIAAMPEPYRALGERLHALILRSEPALQPTLWYGMPAYAKDSKVICFFRADKYMTFGLSDKANHALEEDAPNQLRPSAWFLTAMDDATETRLSAIVRKAAS
ncbi:MAG: DUF1801 domain-containing protein [Acidobacteria bacterium]|nr:DUF1801 domain-containing protein [Acidobacteriota bacterium]